jgi:hypothetical protein
MDTNHLETGWPIHQKTIDRFTTQLASNLAIAIKKPFNTSTNTANTMTTNKTTHQPHQNTKINPKQPHKKKTKLPPHKTPPWP